MSRVSNILLTSYRYRLMPQHFYQVIRCKVQQLSALSSDFQTLIMASGRGVFFVFLGEGYCLFVVFRFLVLFSTLFSLYSRSDLRES